MARRFGLVFLALPFLLASGCAMRCAPYDCNYPYIGGRWVRDNPTSGRVGSIIEPAGTRVEGDHVPQTQGEAIPTPVPTPVPTMASPVNNSGMQSVMPRRNGNNYLPLN